MNWHICISIAAVLLQNELDVIILAQLLFSLIKFNITIKLMVKMKSVQRNCCAEISFASFNTYLGLLVISKQKVRNVIAILIRKETGAT